MSDRFNVELEIGGNCPKSRLKELAGLLLISGWHREWDAGDDNDIIDELRMPAKSAAAFTQHDARIDMQDELLDLLEELKLPFIFHVSGDVTYDGDITWWCPGYTDRMTMSSDVNAQEVMVNRRWLEGCKSRDLDLAGVISYLSECPPTLPPFKIVPDEIAPTNPT